MKQVSLSNVMTKVKWILDSEIKGIQNCMVRSEMLTCGNCKRIIVVNRLKLRLRAKRGRLF
jgi:hypothetical protein